MRDNRVQSVTRAVGLLKLIANYPQGVGVAELARQTELHKSTVSRLVMTLEAAGALMRTTHRSDVKIEPTFANLFIAFNSPNTLITLARPFLRELSLQFGEATGLAIPDGEQAVYIDQVSPDTTIQVRDWTGFRFPLHTVSAGKLFLAFSSEEEQARYLAQPLAAYTPNTVTDPSLLEQSLQEIRTSGVSWIFEEFADGLSAVAAPVFDPAGSIISALSLYGPSYRFPANKTEQINALIKTFAEQCTAQLQSIHKAK